MKQEEKQLMSDGVNEPDEHLEAKAAVTCFMLFVAAFIVLALIIGVIEIVKSIF